MFQFILILFSFTFTFTSANENSPSQAGLATYRDYVSYMISFYDDIRTEKITSNQASVNAINFAKIVDTPYQMVSPFSSLNHCLDYIAPKEMALATKYHWATEEEYQAMLKDEWIAIRCLKSSVKNLYRGSLDVHNFLEEQRELIWQKLAPTAWYDLLGDLNYGSVNQRLLNDHLGLYEQELKLVNQVLENKISADTTIYLVLGKWLPENMYRITDGNTY